MNGDLIALKQLDQRWAAMLACADETRRRKLACDLVPDLLRALSVDDLNVLREPGMSQEEFTETIEDQLVVLKRTAQQIIIPFIDKAMPVLGLEPNEFRVSVQNTRAQLSQAIVREEETRAAIRQLAEESGALLEQEGALRRRQEEFEKLRARVQRLRELSDMLAPDKIAAELRAAIDLQKEFPAQIQACAEEALKLAGENLLGCESAFEVDATILDNLRQSMTALRGARELASAEDQVRAIQKHLPALKQSVKKLETALGDYLRRRDGPPPAPAAAASTT